MVGRFVPENNLEIILTEFMKSDANKDLVIISNVENNKFYCSLTASTNFQSNVRIKIVGSVYDQKLLHIIRCAAYGYIHGHEVGGTNPSLLETLASTELNLLLEVDFNKEVTLDSALYWNKGDGSLSRLLEYADKINEKEIIDFGNKARQRIKRNYQWENVVGKYEEV